MRLLALTATILLPFLLAACYTQSTGGTTPRHTSPVPCDDRLKQAIHQTTGAYGPDGINQLIIDIQQNYSDCTPFTWDPIPDEAKDDQSCSSTPLKTPGTVGDMPIPPDLAWTDQDPAAATGPPPSHWLTPDSTVTRSGNVIIHWSPIAQPHDEANCWMYNAYRGRWAAE